VESSKGNDSVENKGRIRVSENQNEDGREAVPERLKQRER
jgi:hypothetical protein